MPNVEGEVSAKRKFKAYPIGYFHIDITKVRAAEGKLNLFVAIHRTSKLALVALHEKATTRVAADFLFALVKPVPCKIRTVLTDNGTHFTDPGGETWTPAEITQILTEGRPFRTHAFEFACARADIDQSLTKPKHPWINGQVTLRNRAIKDATVKPTSMKLKTLERLTSSSVSLWTKEPKRFMLDPPHHMGSRRFYRRKQAKSCALVCAERARTNLLMRAIRIPMPWQEPCALLSSASCSAKSTQSSNPKNTFERK